LYRFCAGQDAVLDVADIDFFDFLGQFMPHNKLQPGNASEDFLIRIALLFLDIARDPQETSAPVLCGLWQCISWACSGRPAVAVPLIEAGVIEIAIAMLQQSSPADWISWKTPIGVRASGILSVGCEAHNDPSPHNLSL
jgi:hypothetical protein